jgi:RsiW-degrading membrane proteinase PrsW (M82 family)
MQRRVLWLIVGVAGGALVLLGSGGGLLALTLVLAGGGTPTAADSLPVAGIMASGLGLGVPLALHGWGGWRARPSRPFGPSRVLWMWLALMLLIGLGMAVSSLSLAPALLLPPIHVLTMALPPLIVLWLVGWALRGVGGSWREVVAGMAGGGVLGLGAALIGEGLIAFALAVVVTAVVLTMPGGAERIASLARELQDPAWVADLDNLLPFLLSPVVAISALALFSVPVPLIEETFKTLVAGVVARWVRPQPARAFLWGVAAGAGFALVENLFNGALGGAESWALGAVARFGATVMHCLTGGLVGWGWGQLWTARRPLRLLGSYAAAVTVHGLWNAAAVGAVLLSASTFAHKRDGLGLALLSLGMLAVVGLLGLLTVMSIFALPLAGRRLAARAERLQGSAVPSDEVPATVSSELSVP